MDVMTQGQHGFSLMEVLVAMVVLSVGLLGLAALQTQGMRYNNEAYFRTQANNAAYQFIAMMRADRENLADYMYSAAQLQDLQGGLGKQRRLGWAGLVLDRSPHGSPARRAGHHSSKCD